MIAIVSLVLAFAQIALALRPQKARPVGETIKVPGSAIKEPSSFSRMLREGYNDDVVRMFFVAWIALELLTVGVSFMSGADMAFFTALLAKFAWFFVFIWVFFWYVDNTDEDRSEGFLRLLRILWALMLILAAYSLFHPARVPDSEWWSVYKYGQLTALYVGSGLAVLATGKTVWRF